MKKIINFIFSNLKYYLVFSLITLGIFLLYTLVLATQLANYGFFGWFFAILFPILTGLALTLLIFRKSLNQAKVCTASGALFGILTTGCSVCIPPLLSVAGTFLGLGSAFETVPTWWKIVNPILKISSLLLLLLTIYLISKRIK